MQRQKAVPLVYEGVRLECGYRADLVVDGEVVVEIKCRKLSILWIMHNCCLTCDCSTFGLVSLINFHVLVLKHGIKRMVNNYEERPDELLVVANESPYRRDR